MNDNYIPSRWQREFPGFEGMDFEMPEGFVDESDRRSGSPRFVNEDIGLELYVEHVDPSKRQHGEFARFSLVELVDDRCGSAEPETLADTEDFEEVLAAIEDHRSRMSPGAGRP